MKSSVLKWEEAMNPPSEELERIYQLLKDLNHLKPNSPEYNALVKTINTLSAEYDAMVGSPKKPNESNSQTSIRPVPRLRPRA